MTPEKHDDDLAYEQSVNERYLRQVESSANDAWRGLDTVAAPANTAWTGDGPKKPRPKGPAIPLIGRVALATDDEELGRSFYVGGGFTPLSDGITVVSWAAEAARLFYEGRNTRVSDSEGIDPQSVVARRSFEQQALCLVDFEDDCEPDVDPRFAFEQPSRLAILPPPASPGQHEASGARADSTSCGPGSRSRSLAAGRRGFANQFARRERSTFKATNARPEHRAPSHAPRHSGRHNHHR